MTFLDKILHASHQHREDTTFRSYTESRGVSREEIDRVGIGYFPPEVWPPYFNGGKDEDVDAYLKWSGKGIRLRGKMVFPMRNAMGHVIGIQVRTPDHDQKDYSKFYLRRSKAEAVFFGIDVAMPHIWATRQIVICEGLFDYFPLYRVFPNAVCTGTANVSHKQIDFMKRFVSDVVVAFDSDWGGNDFYKKFEEHYSNDFLITRLSLHGTKDVSKMWEKFGDEAIKKMWTALKL